MEGWVGKVTVHVYKIRSDKKYSLFFAFFLFLFYFILFFLAAATNIVTLPDWKKLSVIFPITLPITTKYCRIQSQAYINSKKSMTRSQQWDRDQGKYSAIKVFWQNLFLTVPWFVFQQVGHALCKSGMRLWKTQIHIVGLRENVC